MTVVMARSRPRGFFRFLSRAVASLLIVVVATVAALWVFGPDLIAPREDFAQGPSGVVAYMSLSSQLRAQTVQFLSGQDVKLVINQSEFSGMVSSALLSGRSSNSPVRKVRADLPDGQIRVDTILELHNEALPARFQGPVGLTLSLQPVVTTDGQVLFHVTSAHLGRLSVPIGFLRWAGQHFDVSIPGYDAKAATIELPVSQMITGSFGRKIQVKQFTSSQGRLALVMSMPHSTK